MTTKPKKRKSPSNRTQKPPEAPETPEAEAAEASHEGETTQLEAIIERQHAMIEQLSKRVEEVASNSNKLNTFQSPETVIEAARKRAEEDYLSSEKSPGKGKSRTVDVNNPESSNKAWPDGLVFRLKETSSKYPAYQLDEDGEPVEAIYEYQCNGCSETKEAPKGQYSKKKRKCLNCGSDLMLTRTEKFKPGTPALGVIMNFMYTTKKGIRKYKVYFEKFSANRREEGLLEIEMEPVA